MAVGSNVRASREEKASPCRNNMYPFVSTWKDSRYLIAQKSSEKSCCRSQEALWILNLGSFVELMFIKIFKKNFATGRRTTSCSFKCLFSVCFVKLELSLHLSSFQVIAPGGLCFCRFINYLEKSSETSLRSPLCVFWLFVYLNDTSRDYLGVMTLPCFRFVYSQTNPLDLVFLHEPVSVHLSSNNADIPAVSQIPKFSISWSSDRLMILASFPTFPKGQCLYCFTKWTLLQWMTSCQVHTSLGTTGFDIYCVY